ncbi:hypothetical protein BaRGS_00001665 [Batillaria attramentaria]|uniref:Uncharacterized protein n=1 Tax=Batillaria attramentaria TaxID=370345 RepID=A0ABD0M5Y1_9CAEN
MRGNYFALTAYGIIGSAKDYGYSYCRDSNLTVEQRNKRRLQHMLERRHLKAADMTSHRERRKAPKLPLSGLEEMTSVGVESEFQVTKATTTFHGQA